VRFLLALSLLSPSSHHRPLTKGSSSDDDELAVERNRLEVDAAAAQRTVWRSAKAQQVHGLAQQLDGAPLFFPLPSFLSPVLSIYQICSTEALHRERREWEDVRGDLRGMVALRSCLHLFRLLMLLLLLLLRMTMKERKQPPSTRR
jgi:hypothetical protein